MDDPRLQDALATGVKGSVGAAWGLLGVVGLIVVAVARLLPMGLDALSYRLGSSHWTALGIWLAVMAWAEGYRGFHRSFSPMVAARARYLREHPRTLHVALAPLFCMGLLHATRRRRARSASLTLGILAVVALVRRLEQPWRGIVDLGVVLGLAIGLCSLAYFAIEALASESFEHPTEVPGRPE